MSAVCSRGRTAFPEIFRRAGGNAANLTALFDGRENDDTRLYHKLLFAARGRGLLRHTLPLVRGARHRPDGPPTQSDDIEVEKYFAVPGQDLVLRWLAPRKGRLGGHRLHDGQVQRRRRPADAPPPQRQRVLWRLQQGRQPVAAFGRGHQMVHRLAGGARGQPVYSARLFITASAASARTSARPMSAPTASGGRITMRGAPTGGGCPG